VKRRGLFEADLLIVYMPWTDLRRPFTNSIVTPFWSESPEWAIAEFLRHAVWAIFGKLAAKWKCCSRPSASDEILELNIRDLQDLRDHCRNNNTPVYFFWSPSLNMMHGKISPQMLADKQRFYGSISNEIVIDVEPALRRENNVDLMFVDDTHYSAAGHRAIGEFLAKFVRSIAYKFSKENDKISQPLR
jgi:hypothetical protein